MYTEVLRSTGQKFLPEKRSKKGIKIICVRSRRKKQLKRIIGLFKAIKFLPGTQAKNQY
jgi:hypothetical protein